MKDAQPPPGQVRSAPPKAAVAAKTAPAAGAAAPQPAAAVMPRPQVDVARSLADQSLSMEPLASADNDPSLAVDWRPIQLGAQRTLGCGIQAPAGHVLRVLIEQGVYRKTLSGAESIDISAVPVAASGTEGTLSIQDETGGASATFTWTWHPPGMPSASRTAKLQTVPQARQAKKAPAAAAAARAATNAASTVFFGQPAQGQRIAFILDMSGSMAGRRWETCLRELTAALQALSGRGEFFVVLFSDHLAEPPGQLDWMMAHPDVIRGVIDWMTAVEPTGGTMPGPAFERVFALSARPAAIYFLTDGIFADCTAEDVARLNGHGTLSKLGAFAAGLGRSLFGKSKDDAPAVINTIALDDAGSAPMLQKIAADSGGDYAHASSG